MADFSFSPKTIAKKEEKKIAIERLPAWAQNAEQIQKYFDDAVQHWFTPEQQRTLDGYIGKHGGADSTGKVFINEISPARTEYQLAPAMVSTDATNTVQTMLTYPDLVDNLAFNGSLADNESRLLSGRYYCWAPAVNPDMLINYSNYYWDTTNADGIINPDYIVMERGSRDGNMWSVLNNWYPVQYTNTNGQVVSITNEDITSGKFIQAQRPIIEFLKDMELYDYGRNARTPVDLLADNVTPEDIMFRSVVDNIRVDGQVIKTGDRILFTSIANSGENNRVYKVVNEIQNGVEVYGLTLDPIEMTPTRMSGEPKVFDAIRIKRGNVFKNVVVYWNGSVWVKGQQKTTRNQAPLFNLYDKASVSLSNAAKYPGSTFAGSKVFSVKLNQYFPEDSIYGQNIEKDKYGSFVYQNHIQSDKFTYLVQNVNTDMVGMKFYNIMQELQTNDKLYSDWREASIPTRQYISQTIAAQKFVAPADKVTGTYTFKTEYPLAVAVGTNPTGVNYPLSYVDVNGEMLESTQYTITDKKIEIKNYKLTDDSVITVNVFNNVDTPDRKLGSYEIPSNLKNNANNASITVIEESRLADHFYDIIRNQDGFTGSAVGINNYYNTKRDMSVGRKIIQHDASLLPLMIHNSDDRLDIIKASSFVKNSYNSFRNKFETSLSEIDSKGYGTQTAAQVVADILKRINVGKSDEFAFWLSGVGTTSTTPQTFIPETPQYLGMLQTTQPRIRVRLNIEAGMPRLYNITHTGTIVRSYSSIASINGSEQVVRDFRDDVLFELEMMIFRSINTRFTNVDFIPALSVYDVRPGVFRTTEYTASEWDSLALRSFEQWAISNSVDYRTNSSYDQAQWKTWNYSESLYNKTATQSRGNWKAIYMDHFDTISPNVAPWEMLGFSIKPLWWDEEYRTTVMLANGNKAYIDEAMWTDIETGTIRRGDRAGVDKRFVRTGFKLLNPVSATGELVAPHQAVSGRVALVDRMPNFTEAQADWKFSDLGDIEFSYLNSNFYSFETAITLYRAKPAQWTNYFWDTANYSIHKFESQVQWIRDVTDSRLSFDNSITVHGENLQRVIGYQMWVSDFLKHNHMDITRNYGNYVRGAGVKLSYRLGGFSKKENLTFVSDSFGLVSQENQQLTLLKSKVRKQEVLSGLKVTYDKGSYVISGFDSTNPQFEYFEPNRSGSRYPVTVAGRAYVQYKEFESKPSIFKYDTKLRTIQEVYDFIIGYGEYLDSRGWLFEDLTDDGEFFDWRTMGTLYAQWASSARKSGDFVTLSPAAGTVKFATEHGSIDSVTQFSGGSWTLVDANNSGISENEINISRIGNIINVRLNDNVDKRIMLLRLNVSEYEHAVVFDNTTIFGDVVYIPELGLHQQRLRAHGSITDGWNGRLEAPGFMIVGNDTLPNFEKLVNDFKHYYDNESPTSSVELNNLARHVIGYQSREYLRRLIVNERNQVEFYKGYIKEKGTIQSFDKVLRTSKNLRTPNYKVIEEWAFKIGEYGDVANDQRLEFVLKGEELKQEPQNVVFDSARTSDIEYDDVVTYFGNKGVDSRWITRSVENQKFPTISRTKNTMDVPSVGPINLSEVDIVVYDISELAVARNKFYKKNNKMPETVWMINNQGTWDLLKLQQTQYTYTHNNTLKTDNMNINDMIALGSGKLLINFPGVHNMYDNDIFFFYAKNNSHPELNIDSYFSFNPAFTDRQVLMNATAKQTNFRDADGDWVVPVAETPYLYIYRSVFANEQERAAFVAERSSDIVDIRSFKRPVIYNTATNLTETYMTLWDPMQGVIPGVADAEIKFKTQHDPAMYNNLDKGAASWGPSQVGTVWWDTSKAFYLDYTQPVRNADKSVNVEATRIYRRENWGKMLPSGEVVLYEWVKSPVHPVNWATYSASQDVLNKEQGLWIPSGVAVTDNWCEVGEYDNNSGEFKTYYYFWVKDAIVAPNVKGRVKSVAELTRIVKDPRSLQFPWFAPVSDNEFIVSGISSLITDDHSVLQIVYQNKEQVGTVHKQWQLFQEGNDYNFDIDIWNQMFNSLVGETLPDSKGKVKPLRYPLVELGNTPETTWFKDIIKARREFVSAANLYFASTNTVANSQYMSTVFNYVENARNPYERDVTIVQLNNEFVLQIASPERFINNDAVTISTNGVVPKPLDKSITYFAVRVPGQSDKFRLKVSPNSVDGITILDKGLGELTITRTADANAARTASLNMPTFWNTVDWYASGYSSTTPFTEVSSTAAADALHFNVGDVIKVIETDGTWTLYVREFSRDIAIWATVGRKSSTIQLNDKLFADVVPLVDGVTTPEEQVIQKALRKLSTVFTDVQSRMIFPMIYYVHTEQPVVEWVFKTSYISILGIDKTLSAGAVTSTDQLSDVTDYINEVKPYRAKIRGSIDQRTSDTELIAAKMWDTDTNPDNTAAYVAEYDKEEADRDFSKIGSNFRQQQTVVLYDHISVAAEPNLKDALTYEGLFSTFYSQNDETVRLPAEMVVTRALNSTYDGTYTEILDTSMYPSFNNAFHPFNAANIIIDRSRGIYKRTANNKDYFIWNLVGFGWIISTLTAAGVDWYYEDTRLSNSLSVATPQEVQRWLSSDKLANGKGKTVTLLVVTETVSQRKDPEKSHNIERFMRNEQWVEQHSIAVAINALNTLYKIPVASIMAKLSEIIVPNSDGSIYFSVEHFRTLCKNTWVLSDEQVMAVINLAYADMKTINTFLNTANRVRIYNPDASDEYIKSVVNGGFKGAQVHNQPNFRGGVGYAPQSDATANGYELWEFDIYTKLYSELRASGLSDIDTVKKLASYGYGSIINYVPYKDYTTNIESKSVLVELQNVVDAQGNLYKDRFGNSYKVGLNDQAWNGASPLFNSDYELLDGYVNDLANYDSLGYDKQTRSIVIDEVPLGKYVYDISELMIEDEKFSKLTVTISDYLPETFADVDYGIYLPGGAIQPGSTKGSLTEDYFRIDNWTHDSTNMFGWDFGANYGTNFGSNNGSFSVEGMVIRDPRNPNQVVVSAPRTIKPYTSDWDSESKIYPSADRKLYPFSLAPVADITDIRIGNHTLRDGDEVILFANDDDIMTPSGADFNQVNTVYTIKVIDKATVRLMSGTTEIKLDASQLAQYGEFGSAPVFSMFHLVRPQPLNQVRIDTLNYSKFYGRYLSGGKLFNDMRLSGTSIIIVPKHRLVTGDKVIFNSATVHADLANLVLTQTYYVIALDADRIQIVPTIDDAILSTNQVTIGLGIKDINMSQVNFWFASTTQSTRRERSWQDTNNRKAFYPRVDNMKAQFAGNDLISLPTDEIVDHGFARPQIAEGSLRDLVRTHLQEHVSITVYQDERALAAATSSQVRDSRGVLMYNKIAGSSKPTAFRLSRSPGDQTWNFIRLADSDVVSTVTDFWYNDDSIIVDAPVPVTGIIEIDGEYIQYRHAEAVVLGSQTRYKITGLLRGTDYTHEGYRVKSGASVTLITGSNQQLSRHLTRDKKLSPVLDNSNSEYAYASTIMFDMVGDYFEALKNDSSEIATEFKANRAAFEKINGL